jgi:N-acetylglucosaminyl-diphospho-decaprenol L-rhamnosyltransferase
MKNNFELITIVLIAHKSKKIVLDFINNLSKDIKILVIDNSNDLDLKNEINKKENVKIKFMNNNGYGSAINYARTYIGTKYFFIFSPDVKNIDDKFIEIFVDKLKEIKTFGALGPRFLNVTEKSHNQSNIKKEIGEIASISGAAMFFETNIFDKIGGFDENFFLYFEETDYCKRAQKMGYKIYQINSIKVVHPKGKNSGVVKTKNLNEVKDLEKLYTWHFMWSKFYYYRKHYGLILTLIFFTPIILRIKCRIIFYTLKRDKKNIDKYKTRWSGLINSINRKKSYLRA